MAQPKPTPEQPRPAPESPTPPEAPPSLADALLTTATPGLRKRCPACDAVADERAAYCQHCGGRLDQVRATTGDPNVGREIDSRFTIERELGRGGMGIVYAALHHGLGAQVAVKLLPAVVSRDPTVRARFRNEARAAAQVRHPHIVRVLDFGETSAGELYLAMELVDGESLSAILKREAPLGPERAAGLVGQLLDGLSEAHALGIVHRDLKPDNLLVERRRGADHLKILDFGIAREQKRDDTLTGEGDIIGTPAYMSPEQVVGEPADARSDLYSVGVVLRELLTGEPLFPDCKSTLEVLKAHLERPVPPFDPALAPLRDRFEPLLLRALAKKPEERFQSAEQFLGALRAAQATPLVLAAAAGPRADRADGPTAAELTRHAAALWRRPPGVSLVLGAERSGKSTLARTLAQQRRDEGRAVLTASGMLAALPRPLVVARALALEALGAHDVRMAAAKLEAQPEGDRLGLRVILDDPGVDAVPYPVRLREASAAFTALLRRTGADLVLDDAHAIDAGSWRLLERVLQDLGPRRVVLLSRTVLPPWAADLSLPAAPEDAASSSEDLRALSPPAQALLALLATTEEPLPTAELARALPTAQLGVLAGELATRGVGLEVGSGLGLASPSERFAWYQRLPPEDRRAGQVALFRVAQLRGDLVGAASMALSAYDSEALGGAGLDAAEVVDALVLGGDHVRARFDDAGAQRAYRAALDVVRREASSDKALLARGSAAAERLSRIARYRGDLVGAEMFLREAARLSQEHPVQLSVHRALRRVATSWGLYERGEAEARAAVHVALRLGDPATLAECYAELADALAAAGAAEVALHELEAAARTLGLQTGPDPDAQRDPPPTLVLGLVRAAVRAARAEAATTWLQALRAAADRGPFDHGQLAWLLEAVPLAGATGDLPLALELATRALELARSLGDRLGMVQALNHQAALLGERTPDGMAARTRSAALAAELAATSERERAR